MQALWIEAGRLEVRELPPPRPAPGEALVRVLRAGVCGTDLELLAGYREFTGVPGHEFVGRVDAGPADLEGARVVGDINVTCGVCPPCRRSVPEHCDARTVVGIAGRQGAFADYLALPVANLHRIPDHLSDDEATFVEPLAAALRIQQQVDAGPGRRVLVLGAGNLGQLVARSLASTGCDLTVAVRGEEATMRLEALGIATHWRRITTCSAR
jgi:threonine dehydrogenase-like Zn-dependent dehydrogenase